ncbi:MAG TPA: carboxypeptidase-like regulatory domain-containing protein, partial [Polyangiaceae bacterium LLY-WYZ-15_(1-7)]|nr:carboxypeptidase-like regulatory domain-containing protein [Polyangiaceae bacterium LLY-WYZ-15_(1-7)]
MRHASPIARLTLAATLLCAAGAAAQPRVRVRAESRIELRTERPDAPGSVLLQGVLRDDLGAPLPGREVELQVRSAQGTALRATRRTDRDGAFEVELELAEGDRYQVTAAFAGDAGHERLRVERGLDLARAETHVTVEVPDRGRIDLDRESHEVGVRVRTPLGGGGLP